MRTTLPYLLLLLLFMVHKKVEATDKWPLPDSGQNNVTLTTKVASRNIGPVRLKKSYMTNFRLLLMHPGSPQTETQLRMEHLSREMKEALTFLLKVNASYPFNYLPKVARPKTK